MSTKTHYGCGVQMNAEKLFTGVDFHKDGMSYLCFLSTYVSRFMPKYAKYNILVI